MSDDEKKAVADNDLDTVISVFDVDAATYEQRVARARADAELQASMTLREAIHRYPHAIMWSLLFSCVTLMESYDYGLMGNFFGLPAFEQKYGTLLATGKYNISADLQTVLKQTTKAGQVVGLILTGAVVDRIGYRWTQIGALVFLVPIVLLQFMAPNINALIAAQTLIGVPLASFLTLSNVYASEVAPLCLRPYLTTFTQSCWVIGGFISTGILRGFVNDTTQWAFRIPFAVQWVYTPMVAILVLAVPESPQWLVKKGNLKRARQSLKRLSGKHETESDRENRLAYMHYVNQIEANVASSVSYLECFHRPNLRRTMIACGVYSLQPMCGYALANSPTYFFQQAGLDAKSAFNLALGNNAISLVCCFLAWPCMRYFGRRPLLLLGLAVCLVSQITIGALGIPKASPATGWATGGITYLFSIAYSMTIGPLPYLIITDVPTTRLRPKTAVLARGSYIVMTVFNVIITNYQINATAWAWRGRAGWFWAGSCVLCIAWTYYCVPETKNRNVNEIDVLFEQQVPARKFASTSVELVG